MKTKFLIVCCISGMLLAMGLLAGCNSSDNVPVEDSVASSGNAIIIEDVVDAPSVSTAPVQGTVAEEEEGEKMDSLEVIANGFIKAFFGNDLESIKSYLTSPYDWDIYGYSGDANTVCNTTLKGLNSAAGIEIGDSCTLSYEFKNNSDSDYFVYLTMEFVKEVDGWKLSFYGLEG